MAAIDYERLVDELQQKYSKLHSEYLRVCEDNQELNDKVERLEDARAYREELCAKLNHFEMLFNDAERNRQILAAQMDVVRMIFAGRGI